MSQTVPPKDDPVVEWLDQDDDRPWLSRHVVGGPHEDGSGRWAERTPDDAVSPERAYQKGVDLPGWVILWFAKGEHDPPDRVRMFADHSDEEGWYVVLFLVHGRDQVVPHVSTVLRVDRMHHPAERAYLHRLSLEVFRG